MSGADVEATLSHIKDMWPKLTFTPNSELRDPTIIKVSNPYLIPSRSNLDNFDFNEMYYWDSFFMSLGFMITGENEKLVVGMLENLSQIFDQLQMIPNANRSYLSSHSQPPLLTTFINAADQSYGLNPKLKNKLMSTAQAEYQQVWLSSKKPHWRNVYQGLSRYYDINMLNDMAEAESGWDMTTRFNRLALEFLPVDLNSLLFKYEMDFHHFYQAKGDLQSAARWLSLAEERSAKVYELMWNPTRGMYFDYNFVKKRQGLVASLATYFPMWADMVNEATAFKLKNSLHNFEYYGGLSTTTPILKGPRSSPIILKSINSKPGILVSVTLKSDTFTICNPL